jgi:hypothetical protein
MRCNGCNMTMVAQPLLELPEPQKMGHRLVTVYTENKMVSVGSSHNGCATIGILQPSLHAQFAKRLCLIWICWGSRCRVIAKSPGSEEPGFTSLGALLYGPLLQNGRFSDGKKYLKTLVETVPKAFQVFVIYMCKCRGLS